MPAGLDFTAARPRPARRARPLQRHTGNDDRAGIATWWAFLAACGVLAPAVAFAPALPSTLARTLIATLATLALLVGVKRYRPDFRTGWWLITIGCGGGALAVLATALSVAESGASRPDEWAYTLFAALQYPLFIAGMVVLARLGRTRTADLLDAGILSLATFLLLFALIIRPILPGGPLALLVAVVFPLGALLLFALTIRVALSVGVPTVALGLLLLAMCARVGSTVTILLPALTTGSLEVGPLTRPLSVTSYVLLGAAALHPSLARTRHRARPRDDTVSRRRIVLLALVAVVVVPVMLMLEIRLSSDVDAAGVTVPVLTAVAMLVLLVGRLGLTAGTAQRRATELAERTDDLEAAVREQEVLQQQLRYQAMHDPLTGLANRIVLAERLEWALGRSYGSQQHALALFDLDRFKDINETLGHPAGDELLAEVSRRLLTGAPPGATLVARLGGDEFAVLLEDTPSAAAQRWAEQARQFIDRPYQVAGQTLHISASIGLLTTGPETPTRTPSDALRDADLALFAAKQAGRNQVVVFGPELRGSQLNSSRLSTSLRNALADQQFTGFAMHYQPVVDLVTGRPVGVEALLRWEPPGLSAVPPSEFIPVAEDIGVIGLLGDWAIWQACQDARPWYEQYGISVGVNVSAWQLADPQFADRVLRTLQETGLPPQALILEITESALVTSRSGAVDQLDRLREHRIRLAIDDFGTGYSSLAYVSRLPVDMLKLDRSFLPHGENRHDRGWEFTRAVLRMVGALRLPVVAEGVETLEQAELLRELRCELAQGYLFSKPVPPELLAQVLPEMAAGDAERRRRGARGRAARIGARRG